ncbi:hypothetical protein Btru_061826 [Bulinus truncatus]|nr:hypothetical protein Btru_061826 [Bulinus truncatus]
MSEVKALQEIDELIDLFLSSDFDPLPKSDSAINFKQFKFEADVDGSDSEEEKPSDFDLFKLQAHGFSDRPVAQGGYPVHSPGNFNFKHDEYFKRKCGRALAKMGDELCAVAPTSQFSVTDELKRIFLPLGENNNKESINNSWDLFKNLLDKYIVTQDGDAPKYLGAVLLTVHGLSNLGSGTKQLVKDFTRRYITQRGLDRDIARIGGLNGFMASQLD